MRIYFTIHEKEVNDYSTKILYLLSSSLESPKINLHLNETHTKTAGLSIITIPHT